MARRPALLIALVPLAVAAAALLPGAARAELVTIEVTSVAVSIVPTDAKPKGTSAGDRIAYRDVLLNASPQFRRAAGARVGSDEVTMFFVGAHSVRSEGVATLPDGTIRIEGMVRPYGDRSVRIPVVGGTGRYRKASGTLTIGPGETRALNVYRLRLPGNVA